MTVWTFIRHAPPLPFLSEEHHGKLVVVIPFVWLGDPEEGRKLIQPLRDVVESIGDNSGLHPWTAWQSAFDGLVTHGARNYWKSHHLEEFSDECIDVLEDFAIRMPSNECEIFVAHMEGAPSRVPANATAYAHRTQPFILNIHTRWRNKEDDQKCLAWVKDFYKETKPFSRGVYVNFISSNEEADRVKDAYTSDVWSRLVEIKERWDPQNLFKVNQNIKPYIEELV